LSDSQYARIGENLNEFPTDAPTQCHVLLSVILTRRFKGRKGQIGSSLILARSSLFSFCSVTTARSAGQFCFYFAANG